MNKFKRINRTLLVGALLGLFSIVAAILSEIRGNSPWVFIHPVGLLIVLGGTAAASCISLPWRELKRVYERTYYAILYPKDDYFTVFREIVRLSVNLHRDPRYLQRKDLPIRNAMIRDAINLIEMGFPNEDIRRFLERKREHNESSFIQCSNYFFSISKMGPAFGLLGTLVGLIIVLYYYMTSGDMTRVASSMGVALTATLYGVGLSNLVFGPLAEYMQYTADVASHVDELVAQGVILIKEKRHPLHVVQALKTYVPREDYPLVDRMVREEIEAARSGDQQRGAA